LSNSLSNINILVFVIKTHFLHEVSVSFKYFTQGYFSLQTKTHQSRGWYYSLFLKKNIRPPLLAIRFKITRLLLHRVNYILVNGITMSNMGCTTAHHVRRNCCAQPKIVRLWGDYVSLQCFRQYWRHFFWHNW
jgi:hypothetical protein